MIAQLKKRLSTFLSSVIAVILAAMSILLLHTVIKEYTNSTHVSYSRDVNLLYSYLEQVSILDIPILTEYSEKNLNIDVLRNSNKSCRQTALQRVQQFWKLPLHTLSLCTGMIITMR